MRRCIAAFIGATLWVAGGSMASAADRPATPALNVMVMGEDADEHEAGAETVVVARDTRVFRQVLEAISDELGQEGFAVFDERAVTLDTFRQNRTERGEAELMDIARSVEKPPIDTAVIFTIYAGTRRLAYTTDLYARITGRILNVRTGQKLGSFEVTSPKGWKAPIGCERDCLMENIGRTAEVMAGDLGALMGQKLATITPPAVSTPAAKEAPVKEAPARDSLAQKPPKKTPVYTLAFIGFSSDELGAVEEYLVAFKGYKHFSGIPSSLENLRYSYEIDSDSAHMNQNLRMMLDRIGVNGSVTFSDADDTFTVKKTG